MTFDPKMALGRFRERADLAGIVGGILIVGILIASTHWLPVLPLSRAVFLVFVLGGALVGGIAAAISRWGGVPKDFRTPLAGRIGIRSGTSGAVVAVFFLVYIAVLDGRGVIGWFVPTSAILLPVLLSILPAILAAHLGAAAGVALWEGRNYAPDDEDVSNPQVRAWHVMAGLAALLIALNPFLQPPPPKVVTAPALPPPTMKPAPPPKPIFVHQEPADFLGVDPRTWSIVATKSFGKALDQPAPKFSPDSRRLAFIRSGSRGGAELVVIDVETGEPFASFDIPFQPDEMVWDAGSSQIALANRGRGARLVLVDIRKGTSAELSRLPFHWLPSDISALGMRGNEILIRSGQHFAYRLDLDSLLFKDHNANDSIFEGVLPIPDAVRWGVTVAPTVLSQFADEGLSSAFERTGFAVDDLETLYRRFMPEIQLSGRSSDQFSMTSTGSVLAQTSDGELRLHYFGTAGARPVGYTVDTTGQPSLDGIHETGRKAHESGQLRAFVASPMFNPLTKEVVGANRSQVKALVGIKDWEEGTVNVWVIEDYQPVREGDVVFMLNWTTPDQPTPGHFKAGQFLTWWGVIDGILPTGKSDIAFDRQLAITKAEEKNEPDASPLPEAAPRTEGQSSAMNADSGDGYPALREFVRQHHEVVSSGRLLDLGERYADRVDFFDQGMVTPADVIEDQRRYRENFVRVTENTVAPIYITPLGNHKFRAEYILESETQTTDGQLRKVRAVVNLVLADNNGRIEITRQRSKVVDSSVEDP